MGKRGPHAGLDDKERFLLYVDIGDPTECWPWKGHLHGRTGYGQFRLTGRGVAQAHRAAYLLFVGDIPDQYEVDHVAARGCVRRDCVNWHHLEPVTGTENIQRYVGDRCPKGHVYAAVGMHRNGRSGARRCAACNTGRR